MDLKINRFVRACLSILRLTIKGRKVDFVIAGVQKSGTTALFSYLCEHHDICMSDKKEIHFFDYNRYFLLLPNYLIYHSNFSSFKSQKLIGEATPIYIYWNGAIERLSRYNPNIKIILVLRNPITRAYSHWNMMRHRKKEHLSFLDAITVEPERLKKSFHNQDRKFSYIDRGFYSNQIKKAKQFVPEENLLIVKHDDLLIKPENVMNSIYSFLGIKANEPVTDTRVHEIKYESQMNFEEFKVLKEIFFSEIKKIEVLTGWDCSDWLRP